MKRIVKFYSRLMKPRLSVLLLASVILALSGCAEFKSDPVLINRVIFINSTNVSINDISLRNPETSLLAACSILVPHGFFKVPFPAQPYKDSPAVLNWKQNGKTNRTVLQPFRFKPGHAAQSGPAAVVIIFHANGTMESSLENRQ